MAGGTILFERFEHAPPRWKIDRVIARSLFCFKNDHLDSCRRRSSPMKQTLPLINQLSYGDRPVHVPMRLFDPGFWSPILCQGGLYSILCVSSRDQALWR
jgi:hypothetical protein